ncbi:bifunctional hydroxymethylpyrimidine kinase/phosphomethylpyrimidine kinase [Edaphobacter bradus]|uniref:bifunctional hydroxymethylpyrimidine kinase/phosphomethylpyrimidine kinase n=1 Tax=Edaphobacter bradus TaxID=2259016 RepID=UPI0021DF8A34|nr:bifunctional hydroxymethylpyrimidine kinase/phosphomethylpyrimidine kinase [Edaphobacter bradus]
MTKTVLTIAGYDPSSGAGVTADLMVFAAHGLFGTSCITALTVQSTLKVQSSHPVSPDIVRQTLDCLESDLPPAGIKLGMLASAPIVEAVADYLATVRRRHPRIPVVLDPVLRSTSGRELLSHEGLGILTERLLPLVDWITPNLSELGLLSSNSVAQREDLLPAARALHHLHPGLTVLATGGHLNPPDDLLLSATGEATWLPGKHIATKATHGTGCTLSSAILSRLVLGDEPRPAAEAAKRYVTEALRTASPVGHGHGPLHHLWPLRSSER